AGAVLAGPHRRVPVSARRSAAVACALAALAGCGASGSHHQAATSPGPAVHHTAHPALPRVVSVARAGSLPAPLQDPAVAALPAGRAMALGGLDAADASTSAIRVVSRGTARQVGQLPQAVHDAAAATLAG